MKKYINLFPYIFLLISLSVGCKENMDLTAYDTGQSYIYFAEPNPDTLATERWVDSIQFSFALQNEQLEQKVLAVPIHISGLPADYDRTYSYRIVEELSKANMDYIQISEPVIGAGRFTDSLYVTIQNAPELRDTVMHLVLELENNEQFQVGHGSNKQIRLTFTNQLLEPEWWETWEKVFGPFHPEVYKLWISIYYLGADPSPDLYGSAPGPYYYWDNMPTSTRTSWYPITYMYVQVLREYLEDNPVYPDGDTSKERIYLP